MDLFILRHGDAEMFAASDQQRRLTDRGREQTGVLARQIRALGLSVDVALVSPYVRAQQTAELVLPAFGAPLAETCELIVPSGDPRKVAAMLDERQELSILMVSHQPLVGSLIDYLVLGSLGGPSPHPPMLTSSLAHLRTEFVAAGCAELQWIKSQPDFH